MEKEGRLTAEQNINRTEEPVRLQSMGSQRVGHNLVSKQFNNNIGREAKKD